MINKIILGGQTGGDQGALDAAIELDLPHGGWIPKGRKTEDGPLPAEYQLQEMPTASYPKRTEKNVLDSDGTLIISHSKLTGGSSLTRETANKHHRPWIHIDLKKINAFDAAQTVKAWIETEKIKILNMAGSRASKDPLIYEATKKLLKFVVYLDIIGIPKSEATPIETDFPRTVDEAVDHLITGLPFKDKSLIARMTEDELEYLHPNMGVYIRNKFGLWSANKELIDSCRSVSGEDDLLEDDAASVVIKEL